MRFATFDRGLLRALLVAAIAGFSASCADEASVRKSADPPDGGQHAADAKAGPTAKQPDSSASAGDASASAGGTVRADAKPPVTRQVEGQSEESAAGDPGAPVADPAGETRTAADDKKDAAKDPYAVPDGSPAELLQFIEGMTDFQPDVQTQEEAINHARKRLTAIVTAADKILAAKPEEAVRAQALRSKLQAMWFVANRLDPEAMPKFQELVNTLAADKNAEVAGDATMYVLALGLRGIEHDKPAEAKALVEQFAAALKKEPLDERLAVLAVNVPAVLEQSGHMDLARDAAQQFIAALKQSKNEQLAPVVEQLAGTLKKLEMIGKPLDIEGTLLDGKKFDWSAYKGKVVLVDFWATWCGPCLAELPNVLQTYEKYHDRGFDVVGISLDGVRTPDGEVISLDEVRSKVEKFLADEKIPWPILLGATPETTGWDHPMVKRYGIDGIPAAFLVDKEGKLVTKNARGELLPKLVEELLGPAAGGDTTAEKKPGSGKKE